VARQDGVDASFRVAIEAGANLDQARPRIDGKGPAAAADRRGTHSAIELGGCHDPCSFDGPSRSIEHSPDELRAVWDELDDDGPIRPVRRQEQLSVEKVSGGSDQTERLGSRCLKSKGARSIGAHAFERRARAGCIRAHPRAGDDAASA
jgi:hypothetical protein